MSEKLLKKFSKVEKNTVPARIMLASAPDGGKTTCLASLANEGFNIFHLDFDFGKIEGIKERLTPKGEDHYYHIQLVDSADNPKDVWKTEKKSRAYDKLKPVLQEMKDEGFLDDPKTVVCIDTVTNYANAIVAATDSADRRKLVFESWTTFGLEFRKIYGILEKVNVIFMGHLDKIDREGQPTQYGITLISKMYSEEFPKFTGINGLFIVEKSIQKDGSFSVEVKTKQTKTGPTSIVKNPYLDLPDSIEGQSFLPEYFKRHFQGKI